MTRNLDGQSVSPFQAWNNRWLMTPKLICFAAGLLYYSFYVHRMAFYKEYLGLTVDRSGVVQAVWNVASLVGATGWSNLADVLRLHRPMLIFICLAMAGVFELVLFKNIIVKDYWFHLALVVFGSYGFLVGGLLPLVDDQVLKLLEHQFGEEKTLYGRQASFGMLAYGLMTFGTGRLMDYRGSAVMLRIIPIAALFSAASVATFGHKDKPVDAGDSEPLQETEKFSSATPRGFRAYLRTLGQWRFVLFLLRILATGLGRQVLALFLPYYLKEELGLTDGQIGMAYLASTFASVPFFFIAPYGLQRLGTSLMLLIGQGLLIMRLAAYALLRPRPRGVLLIELMNGMAYSFTHLAAVKEANDYAPPGWKAAFQAAYGCTHVQFPAILCSLIGGFLYRSYGGQVLIMAASIPPVVSFTLLAGVLIIKHRRVIICG